MRRKAAIGIVAIATAVVVVAFSVIQLLDDGSPTETAGPCTTESPTTSLPPTISSTTTPVTGPSTTATGATSTTQLLSPATVVRHGSSSRPLLALTFDAGSDAGATSRILDLLAARDVTATFGLTGCWVEENPTLARRIVDDGHGVINHTQDHPSFTGFSTDTAALTTDERVAQLRDAETVITTVTGADPRPWFRPPFGDYDDSVLLDVASAGYSYVIMWSIDSLGWKGLDPSEVADRTIAALEPGAIVLLHVGSASTDVDALPAILDAAEARGLEPVTVAELVG